MLKKYLLGESKLSFSPWRFAIVVFLIGLCLRMVVFIGPHYEGDELIYMTLVFQLETGKGYSLHDSSLLKRNIIDKNQYDQPLFYHPPGGIALFWLFYKIFGIWGFPIVQLFSYALFFWSMMLCASAFKLSTSRLGLALVACLSAFSPIMAHVTTKYWLDGPLLGFTTLAVALFVWAIGQNRYNWVIISGVILGFASLIKMTAILVVPGLLLISWILLKSPKLCKFICHVLLLLIPAFIVQLPWEICQWIQFGTPFPGWAGKPSISLINSNGYIYFLTIVRSPWVYLTLLPKVLWTLIPSCFLFGILWGKNSQKWIEASLLTWILVVIFFHIVFGYLGYSKVLRYIILVTPASILLFSLLMAEIVERKIDQRTDFYGGKTLYYVFTITATIGLMLEIIAGMQASLNYQKDLIVPIIGQF